MSDDHRRDKHGKKTGSHRPRPPAGKTDPMLRNLKDFVVEEIEIRDTAPPRMAAPARTPSRWWPVLRRTSTVLGLALIAVVAGLVTRSAWPVDETRWLAMAWEMQASGDWLVPRLNGVVQAVPPMLLWVIQLGWKVFEPVEWWARLVPALFMIASLFMAARMAKFLWPGQTDVVRYMPLVLLGGFYWVWSGTFLSPDFLTVFFTLFALTMLLWMWRQRDQRVWLALSVAFGLGLLAAGSLILLYVLPVALLAPFWTRGTPVMPWRYWYLDIFKALVVGLAIFAAWMLSAAARVKFVTLAPVLTAPFASHSVELFAASQSWWWPLFLLPWLAFPWSFWPLPWMRLWHIRREPLSHGLVFCMLWAIPVVVLLMLFSAQQPQFLLPLVPAFFLVTGWLLLDDNHAMHDHSRLASTMIFPLLFLGGALAVLPGLPRVAFLPEFLWQLSPFVGVAIIGVGVAVGWLPIPDIEKRIANVAATVVVLLTLGLLMLGWELNPHHEVSGAARVIDSAQRQGRAVAHVGPYAGQFQFAGRLQKPLEVLTPEQVELWLVGHPDGLLVTYASGWQPRVLSGSAALYEQSYGNTQLRLWGAEQLQGG